MRAECDNCGQLPAKMRLPDTDRYLCGVCAHRLSILRRVYTQVIRQKAKVPA